MDAERAAALRGLTERGVTAAGVFETRDEELTGRGVEFVSAPEKKFYGMEAVFKDSTGNSFRWMERK
jgi:hypothetical protein